GPPRRRSTRRSAPDRPARAGQGRPQSVRGRAAGRRRRRPGPPPPDRRRRRGARPPRAARRGRGRARPPGDPGGGAPARGAASRERIAQRTPSVVKLTRRPAPVQGGRVQIVVVRHADSVAEGPRLPDEHRYLTARGRADARALGALLAEAGIAIGAAVSSPLVRAIQTAELVTGAIGWAGAIEASCRLAPGTSVSAVADWLAEEAARVQGGALIAFGHE